MQLKVTRWNASLIPAALLGVLIINLSRSGASFEPIIGASVKNPAKVTAPQVQFVDSAKESGLTARHVTGGEVNKEYLIEVNGSGVALFDYNNDDLLDVFLVNGTTLEGFPKGQEPTNHLYQNLGKGTFKDVTEETALVRTGWGQGVCVGDFDNDGHRDLFVTYYGQNVLYRNTGEGAFADVTMKTGLSQQTTRWNAGCSFVDYDKDGNLDLFVANYVNLDLKNSLSKKNEKCVWKGIPVVCGPLGLPTGTNILYHGNGDGTFTDVSEKSGIARSNTGYGLGSVVSDFDNDGWPDIYVACDSTANILYHNARNGTFTDEALLTGTAFNKDGKEQGGMGVSVGDYDRDGYFDIVKTNFDGDTPTLYHNNGDGTFFDNTLMAGLGRYTQYVGWGTGFVDINQDGWLDIFMVNGHIYPEVDQHKLDRSYRQNRQVYMNLRDGTFADFSTQAGLAIKDRRSSRGAAIGDLDGDGSLEIVINNMYDTPSLLRNSGDKGNWVIFKTLGTKSNRDGIGARVTIFAGGRRQMDEVRSGGSFISQNDLRLHFGIGDLSKVDRAEVMWPSGRNEFFSDLKAGEVILLEEGKGKELGAAVPQTR